MKFTQILKKSRTGKFKSIVSVGYELLVHSQLVFESFLDTVTIKPSRDDRLQNITAIIKTFERPNKVRRLVKSIKKLYPDLHIIVVDDSKLAVNLEGVETIILPFDSGVSAGRNAGLNATKTKYMLCLDDDFIFNRHTNLLKVYEVMENTSEIDILAGEVIYLPLRIVHDYSKVSVFPTDKSPVYPYGTQIKGYKTQAKVPNFYIGRTEKIKIVGWDEKLKRLDHADFFTRAVGTLTCVQDINFKVLHYPTYFNKNYMAKKNDAHHDAVVLHYKYRRDNSNKK